MGGDGKGLGCHDRFGRGGGGPIGRYMRKREGRREGMGEED